jgi:hypothetical protein
VRLIESDITVRNGSEKRLPGETKRAKTRLSLTGIAGAVVLGLAGIGILNTVACAVLFGQFIGLAVSVLGVGLTWLITRPIRRPWLRILLRAFAFALFLWPFVPHQSVEWSSAWPPAGLWVGLALKNGRLETSYFELISMLLGAGVMWMAGLAVYRDRHRHDAP